MRWASSMDRLGYRLEAAFLRRRRITRCNTGARKQISACARMHSTRRVPKALISAIFAFRRCDSVATWMGAWATTTRRVCAPRPRAWPRHGPAAIPGTTEPRAPRGQADASDAVEQLSDTSILITGPIGTATAYGLQRNSDWNRRVMVQESSDRRSGHCYRTPVVGCWPNLGPWTVDAAILPPNRCERAIGLFRGGRPVNLASPVL